MPFQRKGTHVNAHLIQVLVIAALGSLSYGYAAADIAAVIGQPSFITYMKINASNESALFGAINGVFHAAGIIAVPFTPWIADKFGRKMTLRAGAGLVMLSAAISTGAVDIAMFLIGRLLAGAGCYILIGAVPLWMSEIVPPGLRGTLIDIHGFTILLGYVVAGWIGYGFYFAQSANGNQWRGPFGFQALWPLLFLVLIPWMPESPRWLIVQGHSGKALSILEGLHSTKNDHEHLFARAEFLQIQKQTELDKKFNSTWLSILRKPSHRKRSIIVASTAFFISSSGILVVANYITLITKNLGYDSQQALLFSGASTMVAWAATILAFLIIDHVPRPKFLAFGLFMCACTLLVEAVIVKEVVAAGVENKAALRAALAMLILFGGWYNIGLDATQFCYNVEVWPTYLRAKGSAIGFTG